MGDSLRQQTQSQRHRRHCKMVEAKKRGNYAGTGNAGSHPAFKVMVAAAVKELAEKGGSSRKAILKYVVANYDVNKDVAKVQTYVNLAVRKMLAGGKLVQNAKSAKGPNGAFKLAERPKVEKKVKKPAAKKTKKPAAKKPKKPAAKKNKKPAAKKTKKPAAKKVKKAAARNLPLPK